MNYLKTTSIEKGSSVQLAYHDYGSGQAIILIHGWPLSHAMWEHQIPFLVNQGYRVIAYDRRGFGESSKPWNGYDYNHFAKDLNDLIESLELENVILVGFSMGGGEVARYIGKYGVKRIAKAVLVSSVVPFMLKTEDNPSAVDLSVFEGMKEGIAKDRPGFFKEFGKNFVNLEKNKDRVSQAQVDFNWSVACAASRKATLDCVDAFGKTDFRKDCEAFSIPTLVIHGDDDAIVPVEVSGKKAAELIDGAEMKLIEGAPHGLTFTHKEELNAALVHFFKA